MAGDWSLWFGVCRGRRQAIAGSRETLGAARLGDGRRWIRKPKAPKVLRNLRLPSPVKRPAKKAPLPAPYLERTQNYRKLIIVWVTALAVSIVFELA